jgi:hypothetical protein
MNEIANPPVLRTLLMAACDPDYRREPKTKHFCARCQRDLKPGTERRYLHLIQAGDEILHPEDEPLYVSDDRDVGFVEVGMDCVKHIGLEWTHVSPFLFPKRKGEPS